MSLLDSLENIDQRLLIAINGAHTPFLDSLMFYLSEKWVLVPVYLLLLFYLQKFYGWKITGIILVFTGALIATSDLTTTHVFKNTIMRYRPSHNLIIQSKLHFVDGYKGGQFGFYSSHASNMMAIGIFIGNFLRKRVKHYTSVAIALIFLICYSRIYLGVHYPSDIMAGLFFGMLYALLFVFIYNKTIKTNKL